MDWQKGDAFHPESFKHIFPCVDGVVHTLGILIEDGDYKQALQDSNIPQLVSSIFRSITRDSGNPLKSGMPSESCSSGARLTYGAMNKDSGADAVVCSILSKLIRTDSAPGMQRIHIFTHYS